MSNAIRINPGVLAEQIARLESILNGNHNEKYYQEHLANALSASSGAGVDAIKELNLGVRAIITALMELVTKTHGFLTNAQTIFIEADESLARQLEGGIGLIESGGMQ